MNLGMMARVWLWGGWPGVVVTLWLWATVAWWLGSMAWALVRGDVRSPEELSGVPPYFPGE